MTIVLVTGMSGTGKTSALVGLARRGHRVVDTDEGELTETVPLPDGSGTERLWREDRIEALLSAPGRGTLFVAGCVANQGRFYPRFDEVVLMSAPAEVLLARVASRVTNDYGKIEPEREEILRNLATVEPLLRAGATTEIDTRLPLEEVVSELERIAGVHGGGGLSVGRGSLTTSDGPRD